jgi:hypothetical protein
MAGSLLIGGRIRRLGRLTVEHLRAWLDNQH